MSVKPNRKVAIWWFKTHRVSIPQGKARQTCLVAVRYDDAAVGMSSDNVTQTLQQHQHLETNLWLQGCEQLSKDTVHFNVYVPTILKQTEVGQLVEM